MRVDRWMVYREVVCYVGQLVYRIDRSGRPNDHRSNPNPRRGRRAASAYCLLLIACCLWLTAGERHDLAVHEAHAVEDVAPVCRCFC